MIKFGFEIKEGKIYDTKIQSFKLKKIVDEGNIIYTMQPDYYKRLYLFEALLSHYSEDTVFRILNYNKKLKKDREDDYLDKKVHYITNTTVIYNYPPTYLTKRRFSLYKTCQHLQKKID